MSKVPETTAIRETYYSESYKNLLYEKERVKPKNIKDFIGTYSQKDATYHDLGRKKDEGVVHRRATDQRDFIGGVSENITGSVRKTNAAVDTFKNHSHEADTGSLHLERKHYSKKKITQDIVGSDVLHQTNHEESKNICDGWKIPSREARVTNYMSSSSMKDCLTLPTKVGEMEPKAALYGFGVAGPKDVWAPKAYRPHANSGNQRFYID